jgi:hypothetical protein
LGRFFDVDRIGGAITGNRGVQVTRQIGHGIAADVQCDCISAGIAAEASNALCFFKGCLP